MNKKKVAFTFLEVDLSDKYNLVLPYLAGYACLDPEIDAYWDFDAYRNTVHISAEQLTADMLEQNADVYAISCYVWNMGLIKKALYDFLEQRPNTNVILGGPQASWQGKQYLDAKYPNLIICNGAGEKVFRNYLKELMQEKPDYSKIKGVCFYEGNTLRMTANELPFASLDEVPSPFSGRFFDPAKGYVSVDLETSRNCPFSCLYCCASTDNVSTKERKLTKLSLERSKADILTIAQNKIQYFGIVNPNFGLFPEDLQVAEFIVECKKTYGYPTHIFTSTTRKHLDRLKQIAQLFHDAGITASWEVPVQTLDKTAQEKINRKQDVSDYMSLTEHMNKAGIDTYVEYIWPLPGETVDSFKDGVAQLCRWGSHVIFVYPFTFTNNIGMEKFQTEYGIEWVPSHKSYSEDKFVIKTNEVSYEDNQAGCRYVLAQTVLYSSRSLFMTARYLDGNGIESYRSLFDNFVQFVLSNYEPGSHSYVDYMHQGISVNEEILNPVLYAILYADIQWFDQVLFDFASTQAWWQDETAQLFFELDLLNRGQLYKGNIPDKQYYPFRHLKLLDTTASSYWVELPTSCIAQVNEMLGIKANFDSNLVEINHHQGQTVFDETASLEKNLFECTFVFISLFDYLPEWRNANREASRDTSMLQNKVQEQVFDRV